MTNRSTWRWPCSRAGEQLRDRGRLKEAMKQRDLAALREAAAELLPQACDELATIDFDDPVVTPIETVRCRHWTDGRLVPPHCP